MMKSSMSKIEPNDVNDGPVVSEGGRSPSTLSTGHALAPARGALAPGQRWSVGRKREVVLRLLRGESVELLSRELGVPIYKLEQWRQKADAALDGALKEREADPACGRTRRRHAADRRAEHGDRTAAFAHRASRPFGPQEVAVMATAISPTAGRRYGVARVCQVWGLPRSSFYAARQPQADAAAPAAPAGGAGRSPASSDEALLAAIRADLARSPWTGEGHRKVWARLRVIDGIRVARKRVLRVMREHSLLSPHRARTRTRRAARPADHHHRRRT